MRNASFARSRSAAEHTRRQSGVHPVEQSGIASRPGDFEHSVRIDASGRILAGQGRIQDMAALTAYVSRLGDLIGEFLDLGDMVAFEAKHRSGGYLLFRDDAGRAVGVVPRPHVGLSRLRARFNL